MIKFGAVIPQGRLVDLPSINSTDQYNLMKKFVRRIEELNYYSGWLFDHFHPVGYAPKGQSVFECWTTLTALSESTKKIRLGQMVTCNSFRYPSVLAKMAACFDVISNGRLEFGIGAGWLKEEYEGYGIPFPRNKERVDRLEEAVQVIKKMWTEERANFRGRYYNIKEALNNPKPVQKPHPPILIGGGGEKLTLRVVAKYGDRCNFGGTPEEYKHKLEVLKQYCISEGRPYEEIEKTWHMSPAFQPSGRVTIGEDEDEVEQILRKCWQVERSPGESFDEFVHRVKEKRMAGVPEQIIEKIEKYVELGVTYFILYFNYAIDMELRPLEIFANKVIPKMLKE